MIFASWRIGAANQHPLGLVQSHLVVFLMFIVAVGAAAWLYGIKFPTSNSSYFPHIIMGNDSKRMYRINRYGHSWEEWTTKSIVGKDIHPSAMDIDPTNGTLWWTSEHRPSCMIVNQTIDCQLICKKLMVEIDSSRTENEFETEGIIILPSGELVVLDDFETGTIYHLTRDFSIIQKIEDLHSMGMGSVQGGCFDYTNNTILIVDNTPEHHAVYRLDRKFKIIEKISLETNIIPQLHYPQDLALKNDGSWLLAAYDNDLIYHIKQHGGKVQQLGIIDVSKIKGQRNPTGVTIYRSMW